MTKRRTQLTSLREEGRETSDEDSSVFVKVNSQCWLTRERELNLTKQNLRKETRMISVSPIPQNADCIGDDNSNKPDDVRESEIHMEMSTSVADGHNREDVGRH